MVRKILCIVFSVLLSTPLNAQLSSRTVDADYLTRNYGERNYVRNPGAEVNLSNITSTGTGIVLTRTTATPLYGAADLTVNLAQALNNRVTWTLNSFDRALTNGSCMASFVVSNVTIGTGAALHGQIYQGTNLVGQVQIQGGSNPQSYVINFPCGDLSTATTFEMRLTTAGTTDTTFRIDDVRVGKATNLSNVGQREFIGEILYQNNTCSWSHDSTTFIDFAANPLCITPAVKGKATTSAGKIPGGTFVNLAPGDYLVEVDFIGYKTHLTAQDVQYRITDGTINSQFTAAFIGTSANFTLGRSLSYIFSYNTAQPSVTFRMQGRNLSSGFAVGIDSEFSMKVWRIPSQSEVAISPEQASKLKAGEVFPWAGPTCPVGSLPADGQLLNRSDYPQLFAAIGTAHGFTTATNFRLPDYRGRFLRGVDGGAGNDPDAASRTAMNSGGNTGNNVGSVQGHAFASHNHTSPAHSHSFSGTTGTSNYSVGIKVRTETTTYPSGPWVNHSPARSNDIAGTGTFNDFPGVEHTHNFSGTTSSTSVTINNTGGSETRPVNAYVNWCVRLYDGGNGNAVYVQGPVKAAANGSVIQPGFIGEILEVSSPVTAVDGSWVSTPSLLVTPGQYLVNVYYPNCGGAGRTAMSIGYSTDSNPTTFSDQDPTIPNLYQYAVGTDGRGSGIFSSVVNITTTTNYFGKATSFTANCAGPSLLKMRFIRLN